MNAKDKLLDAGIEIIGYLAIGGTIAVYSNGSNSVISAYIFIAIFIVE